MAGFGTGTAYADATSLAASTTYFTNATVWTNWINVTNSLNQVWTNWISITNSTTTAADNLWTAWNTSGYASTTNQLTYRTPPRRSQAEIDAERQRYAEEQRKAKEANDRAEALLREHLTSEQEQSLARHGKFRVRGSKGGVFDICRGNVIELDPHDPDGRTRRIASVCIHSRSHVPEPDNMLAKKFMLETDEDEFRRIGNFSR